MVAAKSKRARKRHVQQLLFRRGGKRRGAGRKPKGARAGARHVKRPAFSSRHPLHVVVRVVPEVGSLRRRVMYTAIRWATVTALVRERFRIVHVSLQRSHIHLLVEANDKAALARGMQGFLISAARNINTACASSTGGGCESWRARSRAGLARRRARPARRRGKVFADRYHLEVITSPTQARNALGYVLSNWRHHEEDRAGLARTWLVDPFSSAILFPGWVELEDQHFLWPIRAGYDPLAVFLPKTWLLVEGWKRAGRISARDVPGSSRGHAAART